MEELKFIVNELNKHFDTDYNMISFDSLSVTELLQVLVNVLHLVDATKEFEVSKNKDLAVLNILSTLQTIKYVPKDNIDAADFREGIVIGKRNIIHPILYWLLANTEKVKKRVYFATYVEKLEIPDEIITDPEVEQINANYDKLIEEFWLSYNENKNEKKNADESSELQEDTKKMAADMSFLLQRLEMQNDKLKNIPNMESLLASVKAYRNEIKQEKKLQSQLKEHKNILVQMSNDIKSLQSTLNQTASRRPENLNPIQQINEELKINKILSETQLPREKEEVMMELDAFEKVALESEPIDDDLESINSEVEALSQNVKVLLNKKIALTNTNDDQLLPFRNQAMIIANKKEELSNFIMRIKAKNESVLEAINEKAMTLREIVGGDVLHGDELKVFISNLRERSVIYKKYRAYMQGLQAELGIISRTLEILKLEDSTVTAAIATKKQNKSTTDEEEMFVDNVAEVKYKCKVLYQEANTKRSELEHVYDDMTRLRSVHKEFNDQFDETKREFDNATGNLSDELSRMENGFEETESEIKKHEEKWKTIKKDIDSYEVIIMKYSDNMGTLSGINSIIEQLKKALLELENNKKDLNNKYDSLKKAKNAEQEELEQLKRIKQMVLYKLQ